MDEVLKMLKTVAKSLIQIEESPEILNSIYTRHFKFYSSIKPRSFHSVILNSIFYTFTFNILIHEIVFHDQISLKKTLFTGRINQVIIDLTKRLEKK